MFSMLEGLNNKQYKSATETEGYLRVIAGAGSGKTKLLVSRYAYLVNACGVNPNNILCITFTNKAAGEMKKRIRSLIGDEYDISLICTYHGFCVRVLRENADKIFYPKGFQILDTHQQKEILSDIYQRRELKLDHGSFEKILKDISDFKAKREYVGSMCSVNNSEDKKSVEEMEIIEEYLSRQKQIYGLDFNDLLYFSLYLFEKCPEVKEYWQNKLNYIQVDEFQDSSNTEMELIDILSDKHKNLMIVGDPDQNIYEWRGSDVKLLVDFDKSHIPTNTIFLNQNYRSTPQVLTCANTLIDKNILRLKKDLFTLTPAGADVFHYHMKNEFEETEKIADTISEFLKKKKYRYSDFAVLYRSSFLSRLIEKKFTERGIPYEIYGGVKFFQRMEIQDIIAYLRLIAFDDDSSFKRIVNTPRRRFGRTKMQHLLSLQTDDSLFNTLVENADDPVFKNSGVVDFADMIFALRQVASNSPLSETVRQVSQKSGYEDYIRELGNMERFENLSEFQRIAYEFEKSFGEEVTLAEFVNQLALQAEALEDGENDMVKLMTIHAAKGLEFPCVFLIGMSEGIFPSAKTIEERKNLGLEEERRLCYVALTRARERLYLFESEGFLDNGKQKRPSRFLFEIGEENYKRIGVIPDDLAQEKPKSNTYNEQDYTTIKIGDKVSHPVFGEGKVLEISKNKTNAKVQFDKFVLPRDLSMDYLISLKFPKEKSTPEPQDDSKVEEKEKWTPKAEYSAQKPDISQLSQSSSSSSETQVKKEAENDVREAKNPRKNKALEHPEYFDGKWVCTGVDDLGYPAHICELCGKQEVRYVHNMRHPIYRRLRVGCVCAGRLEGDLEKARQREKEFKSREARRETFANKKWKTSKNSNPYIKINDHLVVLYYDEKNKVWKYSIDRVFSPNTYYTREKCAAAVFDELEKL